MKEKISKVFIFLLFSLLGMGGRVAAQQPIAPSPWYIGLRGGMPLGISSFSSFGADKTRVGWSGGLYGGYRFNSVLEIELSAAFSKLGLSAQSCCIEKGYWLGEDGIRYNTSVSAMKGYDYADIKSCVLMQQYGMHLNVNLLGLFTSTRGSRWAVNLSPALYAAETKATLNTISTDMQIDKGGSVWHFGVGGDVMAEYRFTHNFSAGIYSGVTYLAGKRLDGVPEYRHKSNYVWESGIRLGWRFGFKRRCSPKFAMPTCTGPDELTVASVKQEVMEPKPQEAEPDLEVVDRTEVEVTIPMSVGEEIVFPVIYFSFNSTVIEPNQKEKLQKIKQLLEQYPDTDITITGWCDTNGSEAVNRRYSLRRAESVKQWLVKNGIETGRIQILGGGIDRQAPDAAKARRAQTEERRK